MLPLKGYKEQLLCQRMKKDFFVENHCKPFNFKALQRLSQKRKNGTHVKIGKTGTDVLQNSALFCNTCSVSIQKLEEKNRGTQCNPRVLKPVSGTKVCYPLFLRRAAKPTPVKPSPSTTSVAGSGE